MIFGLAFWLFEFMYWLLAFFNILFVVGFGNFVFWLGLCFSLVRLLGRLLPSSTFLIIFY